MVSLGPFEPPQTRMPFEQQLDRALALVAIAHFGGAHGDRQGLDGRRSWKSWPIARETRWSWLMFANLWLWREMMK
jgi:hypothetical protein